METYEVGKHNRTENIYYDDMEGKKVSEYNEKFKKKHAEIIEWFQFTKEFEREERDNAKDDLNTLFKKGGSWDATELQKRIDHKRPNFEIPLLAGAHKQCVGDLRRNALEINVVGVDEYADEDNAEKIEGLIRNIEYQSTAKKAYMHGGKMASACARGAMEVVEEFEDDDSFYTCARVEKIDDPLTIYCDPAANYDFSKAKCGAKEILMRKVDFEKEFPNASFEAITSDSSTDFRPQWWEKNFIRVLVYYEIEYDELTLYEINLFKNFDEMTGEPVITGIDANDFVIDPEINEIATVTCFEDKLPEYIKRAINEKNEILIKKFISRQRKSKRKKLCTYILNGAQILKYQERNRKYVPLVFVTGDDYIVEGKTVLISTIRDGKSLGRLINLKKSCISEFWKNAPLSPYWATENMVKGYEQSITDSFEGNKPFAKVNYVPEEGGFPQPIIKPDVPQSLFIDMQSDEKFMEKATGIYGPRQGEPTQEKSGIAKQHMIEQSENATYWVIDNLQYAMIYIGKVLIDIIVNSSYNERGRINRIMGLDNKEVPIKMGSINKNGKPIAFDTGKYDARIEIAPAFITQQKEAAAHLEVLLSKNILPPEIAVEILPDYIKATGIRNASDLADKIEKLIHPPVPEVTPEQAITDNSGV